MKNKVFGLDIGMSTMKAVWLAEEKGGYNLLSAITVPTPSKGMSSESPLDLEEIAQAIRKLINDAHIETPSVNLALPENKIYSKVLDMPFLSDKELSSAIYWEAEQYIPVSLATITLDWQILRKPQDPKKEGAKMQVLLVGAPTSLINKYEKVLSLAGLEPIVMETEIVSAARALITSNVPLNSMIINIGAVSTSVAIIKDNTLVFTYAIPTGGAAINRAIAADFGFSLQQAEEYKRVYGVSDKTMGGKISQSSSPILMSIVTEIKKGIAYYNERFKGEEPIKQIILSGGTAKLPGIDIFFAQNAGIETVIANPWGVITNQQMPQELIENAPDYTIAMGLAMRKYE